MLEFCHPVCLFVHVHVRMHMHMHSTKYAFTVCACVGAVLWTNHSEYFSVSANLIWFSKFWLHFALDIYFTFIPPIHNINTPFCHCNHTDHSSSSRFLWLLFCCCRCFLWNFFFYSLVFFFSFLIFEGKFVFTVLSLYYECDVKCLLKFKYFTITYFSFVLFFHLDGI